MKNKHYYFELLNIIDLIHSKNENSWSYILRKIAAVFNADEAFFALLNNDNIKCASSLEELSIYVTTDKKSAAYISIKNKKSLLIKNYTEFSSKSVYWLKKGLKSLLSVPIFFEKETFGALQIAYFSKYVNFDKYEIDLLEKIAKVISLMLHSDKNKIRYEQTINMELQQIELIYNKHIPKTYKDKHFSRWITEYLKKILNITEASAVGFVLPYEDIYVAVSKRREPFIAYSKNESVEKLITYKIWKKQIKNILLLEDLYKIDIELSSFAKESGIMSAIFVPIEINTEIVAIFAFGFENIDIPVKDYQILLQTIAMNVIFAIETSKNLSRLNSILTETEEKFTESFVLMMEARDTYTKGHSQRVAFYARKIAETLALSETERSMLYIAGIVHDIGKIGIPDAVLLKPGKLTEEEYKIIQYHSEFSYQIIKDINRFNTIADWVRYHHERCDGSGYPKGLKSKEIPLGSKILAIADVFDAITTNRPYRKALNFEEAIDLMVSKEKGLDKDILNKVTDTLRDSFIFEDMNEPYRHFMPEHIDTIRMEIFTKDFMTGLLRRKTFIKKTEQAIDSNKRFVMFYVDIKNLSRINYQYSMEVGDKVIITTAEVLKKIKYASFIARTQPDVFYFLYFDTIQPEILSCDLKKRLNNEVIRRLSKEEMNLEGWEKVIDFYISFSEFVPGKNAEDMMYECQKRKKEMEELIENE